MKDKIESKKVRKRLHIQEGRFTIKVTILKRKKE